MNTPEWEAKLASLEAKIAEIYMKKSEGSMETLDIWGSEDWQTLTSGVELATQSTAHEIFTRKTLADLLFVGVELQFDINASSSSTYKARCTLQGVSKLFDSTNGIYSISGTVETYASGYYVIGDVVIKLRVDGSNILKVSYGDLDIRSKYLGGTTTCDISKTSIGIRGLKLIFK